VLVDTPDTANIEPDVTLSSELAAIRRNDTDVELMVTMLVEAVNTPPVKFNATLDVAPPKAKTAPDVDANDRPSGFANPAVSAAESAKFDPLVTNGEAVP
jgi:hypothetical protein